MTIILGEQGGQIVAHTDAYFIFNFGWETQIGRLDYVTLKWSLAGRLESPKYYFGAIFDGTKFVIAGGQTGVQYNENCILNDKKMTCTQQKDVLLSGYIWPVLLLIDLDENKVC